MFRCVACVIVDTLTIVQAVPELVWFDEPAFTERNPGMLPAQVPDAFQLEGIFRIEPPDFFW